MLFDYGETEAIIYQTARTQELMGRPDSPKGRILSMSR